VASVVYALSLGGFLTLLDCLGEQRWWLTPLLFFPGQFWLLPLLVLTPVALCCHRRLLWLHAACVAGVMLLYLHPACGAPRVARGVPVRVVTHNLGQYDTLAGLKPFAQSHQAEFIALQEADGREPDCAREFPDYKLAGRGQFLLLSKHPVRRHDWVPVLGDKYGPVAVRFEVEIKGRPFAIYNVHLVTPREELKPFQSKSVLLSLAGLSRTNGLAQRLEAEQQRIWGFRVATARQLAAILQQETLPFLVLGDFNAPNRGYIHHLFATQLKDAFSACGRGYGFTFPSDGSSPLGGLGPWLRLDYIFAGRGFLPVACEVESNRSAQHRAVGAILDWLPAE
jgi:endonuclease/exonuclease/phosphatase family metal-dependent hydrolase